MSPSECPGDGEPRRSTKKYMRLKGKKQRREKIKVSKGFPQQRKGSPRDGGVTLIGGTRRGRDRGEPVCHVTAGRYVTEAPCVTLQLSQRAAGARSVGNLSEGGWGLSAGVWWSAERAELHWAPRDPAWRRARIAFHVVSRGDSPLVPSPAALVGICVTSMTHLRGGAQNGVPGPRSMSHRGRGAGAGGGGGRGGGTQI